MSCARRLVTETIVDGGYRETMKERGEREERLVRHCCRV